MKHRLSLIATSLVLCAATAHAQVQVEAPWARPTVSGQQAGGGFVRLQAANADRLVAASTPAAGRVELHTMQLDGDVMRMRRVDAIELPAGQAVELKPGGLHLMFFELKAPLKTGESFPVTLQFDKAGTQTVQMKVGDVQPAPKSMRDHKGH